MSRSTVRAAFAALALLAAAALAAGCSPDNRPLARVGTRTLTSSDLLDAVRGNEAAYASAPEEAKRQLLDDLVKRELILEAARTHGLDTTASARKYLETLRDRYALEALYAKLSPQSPGVTEAEVRRFHEWRGIQAAARIIYSPDRAVVEQALAELARGQAFAEVADRFNLPGTVPPGGFIGKVSPGQLVPPLDEALLTLAIGQVGGPYETPQGVFLLAVDARDSVEKPDFELAKSQLGEMIRQRKVRQAMSKAMIGLKDEYGAKVEKGAAQRMFQIMTPARMGEGVVPEPAAGERAEVLARWRGGQYTVGDAFDDLARPDVQKPAAGLTPAIEQWIEGRVITRIARAEATRRHLENEPEVQRKVRGEFERFLLEGEFQRSIADVPEPDEPAIRAVWDQVKGNYQQVGRANVAWVIVPDPAAAARVMEEAGKGGSLAEVVQRAGAGAPVRTEVVNYPTSDPNWVTMRGTLSRMQPGEWAAPERLQEGTKFMQVLDKVQDELTFEKLTPDLRMNLLSNAWQIARERRLTQYTDSLQQVLQPNVYAENLRHVPWPPPATIDVGQ